VDDAGERGGRGRVWRVTRQCEWASSWVGVPRERGGVAAMRSPAVVFRVVACGLDGRAGLCCCCLRGRPPPHHHRTWQRRGQPPASAAPTAVSSCGGAHPALQPPRQHPTRTVTSKQSGRRLAVGASRRRGIDRVRPLPARRGACNARPLHHWLGKMQLCSVQLSASCVLPVHSTNEPKSLCPFVLVDYKSTS
jgi:hypothetical protein